MFKYDVGVVGIGRVGLPLSLSLAKKGFRVLGFDINETVVESVNNRVMPFSETGCDDLIKEVEVEATSDMTRLQSVANIVITVGTPLTPHIETDLSQIMRVLEGMKDVIVEGHNIILRSTVAPKTTEYVHKFLNQQTPYTVGDSIFLSFCPERIAEGKALEEIETLPQIIGAEDPKSAACAEAIFSKLTGDIFHTNFLSAELVKLFNNISRYIHFSISNQFAIIADSFGQNIYELIEMSNYKYPRGVIPKPGFTAGACLRKDFGMLNETIPYTDLLLSAWKINEFMPKFLIENLKKRVDIYNKNVAVLGYAFKNDTDDTRDSLVPKLVRYLKRELPSCVSIHDPHLPEIIDNECKNEPLEQVLAHADVVYLAINHSQYKQSIDSIMSQCKPDCWFVDLWNIAGTGHIFFQQHQYTQLQAATAAIFKTSTPSA